MDRWEEFRSSLDRLGYMDVLKNITERKYTIEEENAARAWLETQRVQQEKQHQSRIQSLAEESNGIAKEANQISRSANKLAWIAIGVSTASVLYNYVLKS